MLAESSRWRAWNDEAAPLARPIIRGGRDGEPKVVNEACEKMNDGCNGHARAG